MYSICCGERQKPELGVKLLTELADRAGRKTASRPLDYLEVYVGLLCLSIELSDEAFLRAADRFVSFIHQAGAALEACTEKLSEVLITLSAGERLRCGRRYGRRMEAAARQGEGVLGYGAAGSCLCPCGFEAYLS